ncbi:MAG: DsbA family protein [Nanoarchaeota archaeon]|nr:DsbA family protein [Nanoarchaeota archaeon]
MMNEDNKSQSHAIKANDTITIRKDTLWKYSTFILAAILIVGAFVFFMGDDNTSPTGNVVNNPGNPLPGQNARVEIDADDDAVLGDKDAPVEIIEFSDYQCPFCRKFWTETYSQIKKEYVETGKVKFVYRDFPLDSIHPAATPAGIAAECVREKGGDEAYFKMHDKIFTEGNILDGGSATAPVTKTAQFGAVELKKWAKELGYDIGSCLDSNKYKSEIQNDLAEGSAAGVQGTPAFFVNGKLLSGAQPFSAFKQAIDAELNA